VKPNFTQGLIEEIPPLKERILEEGAGVDASLRINATCELGGAAKIQTETLPLFIFKREEGVSRHHIPMPGKPLRKCLKILFFEAEIFPGILSPSRRAKTGDPEFCAEIFSEGIKGRNFREV
jgi:hypothetical protein